MKEHEIEKLREKLGPEYSVKRQNGAITVELVDIWKGVEFAECVEYYKGSRTGAEIFQGQIYKITDWFKRGLIYFEGFEYGWPVEIFKPSTESAYVEQLKAKAKELYGEIKDGDRFDVRGLGYKGIYYANIQISTDANKSWDYDKINDTLSVDCFPLYKKGKWAKKVEEPIRVEFVSSSQGPAGGKIIAWFQFEVSKDANIHSSGIHLAKCLEDYLNKS